MKTSHHNILRTCDRSLDIILHPLMVAFLTNVSAFFLTIPGTTLLATKGLLLLGLFLLTVFFPASIGLLMKRTKAIKLFWHPRNKKDRRLIILVSLLFFITALSISNSLHMPLQIKMVTITSIYLMCALFLINLFFDSIDTHYSALSASFTLMFLFGTTCKLNVLPLLCCILTLIGIKAAVQMERHRISGRALLMSLLVGLAVSIHTGLLYHFSV